MSNFFFKYFWLIFIAVYLAAVAVICVTIAHSQDITIYDFAGLNTNADKEDLKNEEATVMQNVEPKNGRLIKRYAFGPKISTASPANVKNFTTYQEDNLTWDSLTTARAYVAASLTDSGKVTLYAWQGVRWDSLTVSKSKLVTDYPATWQAVGQNPIIKDGNTIRFLPGKAGSIYGHQAKGIWVGRIAAKFFDGTATPDTGYYAYNTPLAIPMMAVTTDTISTAGYAGDTTARYYKMSYVYDGNQEGLLSPYFNVPKKDSMMAQICLTIDTANFNKRITGINLYKSSDNQNYHLVTAINTLRAHGPHVSNPTLKGAYHAYIPSMRDYPILDTTLPVFAIYDADSTMQINGNWTQAFKTGKMFNVYNNFTASYLPTLTCKQNATYGGGKTTIKVTTAFDMAHDYDSIVKDAGGASAGHCEVWPSYYPPLAWNLGSLTFNNHVAYDSIFYGDNSSGINWFNTAYFIKYHYSGGLSITGHYGNDFSWGNRGVIIDTTYVDNELTGSVLAYYGATTKYRLISGNYGRWIEFYGDTLGLANNVTVAQVMKATDGLYYFDSYLKYNIFDPGTTPGAAYPLAGEVSIDVNGKHAAAIANRLWQGNAVLDPFGKAEVRPDWLFYSEPAQYDVNPISNKLALGDQGGGAITGISDVLGDVVAYKKSHIYKIDNSADNTSQWHVIESFNNLGNVAEHGYINVRGDNYIVDYSGIYRLRPNNLAVTNQTPTSQLRISEPIQDYLDSLTAAQMESTVVGYDQRNDEIIYKLQATHPETTITKTAIPDLGDAYFYLNFDDKNTSKIADSSSYACCSHVGNDFTRDGALTYVNSQTGYGSALWVSAGNGGKCATASSAGSTWTMSCWMKCTDTTNTPQYLLHNNHSGFDEDEVALYIQKGSGHFRFTAMQNANTPVHTETAYSYNINTWYYVVATFPGDSIHIYVNGASAGLTYTPKTIGLEYGYYWYLGSKKQGNYFTGLMDNVVLYKSKVLSSVQRDSLMVAGITTTVIKNARYFAYNPTKNYWREIKSGVAAQIFTPDEAGNLLAYDGNTKLVASTAGKESVAFDWESKVFPLNDDNNTSLTNVYLTYKGDSLNYIGYANNQALAKDTITFPYAAVDTTVRRQVKTHGMKYQFEIQEKNKSKSDNSAIDKVRIVR